MADQEYKTLCRKRATLKGQLTRTRHFLDAQEEISSQDAQVRLASSEQLFRTFDEVQTAIENKKKKDDRTQDPELIAE